MEARQFAPAAQLMLAQGDSRHVVAFDEALECGIGTDPASDFVVTGAFASRHHARIVCRRQSFWLVDESSNGTFVRNEDTSVVFVHRRDVRLWGTGWLSFGEPLTPGSVVGFHHA
jgi:pSer/pThr/pTyr-binding forkhead associated (FHA) protein